MHPIDLQRVVKMKRVCIIEPSSAGLNLIPAAKSMGLYTLIFSANKTDRKIPPEYQRYIDHFVEVDTYDIDLLYQIINRIHLTSPISGIIPGSEYHVPIASQLSVLLNLPGVSVHSVERLRNKSLMRQQLKKNNIRSPAYFIIHNENELIAYQNKITFPCVMKPIDYAGSVHVSKNNSFHELLNSYRSMCHDPWSELGKKIGKIAIVEEYIDGEEFSVEGYVEASSVHIISITKKFLFSEPYFVEMGHVLPANISIEQEEKIRQYVCNVIAAFEIQLSIFHLELKMDEGEPVLMEIAGRLPGDRICELIKIAKSIDFYQIMINVHLGIPVILSKNTIKNYSGIRYFVHSKNNFTHIHGLEQLQSIPGFYEFKLLKKPGEFIPPLKDFSGRVASSIFIASTYETLIYRLNEAAACITFE